MSTEFSPAPPRAPQVVFWYKVYVALNALLYLAITAILAAIGIFAPGALEDELGPAILLFVMAGACTFFALAYLVSLGFPRRPWAWVYDLVVICIGFTGCFTLPFSVALLIFWIKPEVKSWFGVT